MMNCEKMVYIEYPKLAQDFDKLIVSLVDKKLRPERLEFQQRLRLLAYMENAYKGVYALADELKATIANERFNRSVHRHFFSALERANFISIKEGKRGDYFVSAPPMGDVYGGNAAFIMYFTNLALEHAKKNGASFRRITDGCIIVKQYCHCEDVAMGTMENREIHSITDTIIKSMGMDDNPWNYDCCYVWCESDNPRTEIIITDRRTAYLYDDYVNITEEEKPVGDRMYRIHQTRRDRTLRAINCVANTLKTYDKFEIEFADLQKDMAEALIRLTNALRDIITALRTPYVSRKDHSLSTLYTQKDSRRKRKKTELEKYKEEVDFERRCYTMCKAEEDKIVIKTESPYTLKTDRGRELCEDQEGLLIEAMHRARGEMGVNSKADVTIEVTRYMESYDNQDPDADNINTNFLKSLAPRVKIIYSRTIKKEPKKTYDCTITMRPKSCGFSLK